MVQTIFVATAVLNPGSLLAETCASLNLQHVSDSLTIRHVIWDGGSSDGCLEALPTPASHIERVVISQPDRGLYDALARVFELAQGDVHCYLNAGDLWSPQTAQILVKEFQDPDVFWLCGLHTIQGGDGRVVSTRLPFRYSRRLVHVGAYGRWLPTVQQESTYWRSELSALVDWSKFRKFRLAGDAFLWKTFSEHSEVRIIQAELGGFRLHGNHLSADMRAYRRELKDFSARPNCRDMLAIVGHKVLWRTPKRILKLCGIK